MTVDGNVIDNINQYESKNIADISNIFCFVICRFFAAS